MVGNGYHKTVPQEIEREPGHEDGLSIRDPLLDLRVGECGVRANGAIVDERAPGDHDRTTGNRDVRVAELSGGIEVADAQLADLAGTPRCRVLVALAAGLCIVERSQPIVDVLDLVKALPVGVVGRIIDHAVALVVEGAGDRKSTRLNS